jgi:predicted DNA-binding transcriptional regulator AlpA
MTRMIFPIPDSLTNVQANATLPPLPKGNQPLAVIEPEQVGAAAAARIAGVSQATWWRLHAAHKTPRPNRLGCRTLWRVAELRRWIEAGCPDREEWEAREEMRRKNRGH